MGRKPNGVFIASVGISVALVAWGIGSSDTFMRVCDALMAGLEEHFSWVYIVGMTLLIVFSLSIAVSPLGGNRLGADDDRPEYGLFGWFAMLFAASMGVGLVFWGVAEPLSHYIAPMSGIEPMSEASEAFAFRSAFMHWGMHPWACYAVVGMGMAFFLFRRGKPALLSCVLEPVLGRLSEGAVGKGIDVYTTVLTIVGISTSFGMGTLQISRGLEYLFGVPNEVFTWGAIILLVGAVFLYCSVSGIDRGIKYMSNANIALAVVLMVMCFVVGSSYDIVVNTVRGFVDYIANFLPDALRMSADDGDTSWIRAWRVFYWAWWLSWAPFCGLFIARISKGRTIREFVLGVLIVPTFVGALWFGAFGTMGIDAAPAFSTDQLAEIVAAPETALYVVFSEYPFGAALSLVAMIVVTLFFITSANSATFVLAMLSSGGSLEPAASKKVIWGLLVIAMSFMMVSAGGLEGMRTMAIVIAFPFFAIAVLICVSLSKMLVEEVRRSRASANGAGGDASASGGRFD